VVGDVADRALVASVLRDRKIEAIVHFAALKSVAESVRQPERYFEHNVAGSLALFAAALEVGVAIVINSSTCAFDGDPVELPVREAAPTRPTNAYGESKLIVEMILARLAQTGRLRHVTLRYFNAAGAWPEGSLGEDWTGAQNLVPALMRAAATGSPLPVFGTDYPTPDGTAIRDYVHVVDLAEAHVAALDHMARGGSSLTANLGTGVGTSVLEAVAAVEAAAGRSITIDVRARRSGDVPAIWADPALAATILGWHARRDISAIAESAWHWHTAHPSGFDSARSDQS
jgi:UDP-glucose-4-epimerase GalE